MAVVFRGRPAVEAADYLQRKSVGGRFSFNWRDVWQEEHLHAFVVAKMMEADLLEDVHAALIKAQREGRSRRQFIEDLTPVLQAKGWWGRQRVTDPTTGVEQLAQLGSPRRLNTIFNVNMRMANSAGRWERVWKSREDRPFLRYRHTDGLKHPREEHEAWDGITLPIEHVFWQTHWCPNGWGCQCWTQSLRRAEEVTSEEDLRKRGAYRETRYRDKRTGREVVVPHGVDPGFGYNVGQARLAALVPPAVPEPQRSSAIGDRDPASLPELLPARDRSKLVDDTIEATVNAVFDAFSKALGIGEGGIFTDLAQVPVVIGRRMFEAHDAAGVSTGAKSALAGRARFARLFAETLKDPDEIWHSFQTREDGSSQLVRYYVAAMETGGERTWFVVGYHHRDGVWMGTTAFPPGKSGKPANQASRAGRDGRVGTLVYRRRK